MSQSDAENESLGVRLNVIHIHGVDEMSTQDVFDYFVQFAPSAIEWIDDSSCMFLSVCLFVCLSVCVCLSVVMCTHVLVSKTSAPSHHALLVLTGLC